MLAPVVSGDEIDTDVEIEAHRKSLELNAKEKCIPIFHRVSRVGEIRIRFSRKLKISDNADRFMEQIVSSGSIQV